MRTLLLGVSTRALAESAVRDGHDVVAVDFFGDRDQARRTESYGLRRDLGLPATAEGLAEAARRIDADAVVYGSNLENHPEVIEELAAQRRLLGNPADVVREVRDWALLRRFCRDADIVHPVTLLPGEEPQAGDGRWLKKRRRSGGGHGIVTWDRTRLDADHLAQAEAGGVPASAAFVSDGRESRVFAVTEQLLGCRELGGAGFAWCGNLLPLALPAADAASVRAEIGRMATLLTRRFGLVGVNGMDLVIGRDAAGATRPYLIEVNPRFSGSMELTEAAGGVGVFTLHVEGVAGCLPSSPTLGRLSEGCVGKGIVYARRAVTTGDTGRWMERGLRDVPWPGERIAAGHPVCTVFARGPDREACRVGLFEEAAGVYRDGDGAQHTASPGGHSARGRRERRTTTAACG